MNSDANSKAHSIRRRCMRIAITLIVIYLVVVALMVLFESFLVYPAPGPVKGDWTLQKDVQEFTLQSEDGTELVGWMVQHRKPRFHILYFHGNAENVALILPVLRNIRDQLDATVLAVDYRGYGKSSGKPNESGLCADGIAAFEFFQKECGIEGSEIVVFGRSLGGGVAVHVASERSIKALVLQSTFDSMVDVAAKKIPWLPVRWLMRNRFESIRHAEKIECPLVQFHGTTDEIVPLEHGYQLFESIDVSNKKFHKLENTGHNDPARAALYRRLREFLMAL